MENSAYKEKRKPDAEAKPRYVLLKIMGLIAIPYVLSIFAEGVSIYPLMIGIDDILREISPIIFYTTVFCCLLAFFVACIEPGFSRLDRVGYIIINVLLGFFIFAWSFGYWWIGGFKHVVSITHNSHTYHLASIYDGDIDDKFYLFICDKNGIICSETHYVAWDWNWDYSLQVSKDGKSIEVIGTSFYDSTTEVFHTYTPETTTR